MCEHMDWADVLVGALFLWSRQTSSWFLPDFSQHSFFFEVSVGSIAEEMQFNAFFSIRRFETLVDLGLSK